MTNQESKPAPKTESQPSQEAEHEHDDLYEEGEFIAISDLVDKENSRRDTRRKIEIYLEKKRLREQFEDFDESEFGF